ncbi:hypothetical protein [Streptomyces sp. NPDC002573]|uniref:hypothetical protein n=1 Tax=Streptomyces sp. NPDC002573 TaxID=3364651 RepID=UPI00367CC55D
MTAAEFASWLHFAAKATGHEEYAEQIATAEPGMPWRTVWAWWRPANWFMAHPSLNGDYYQVHRRLHEGRELIEVVDQRGPLWLDAETGPLSAARVDDAFGERHVVRIPENALPEGLEHPTSRLHLRDIGLPAWWTCHEASYTTHAADAMRPRPTAPCPRTPCPAVWPPRI